MCRPHADAYDAGTWRWLPNAAFRAQLARDPSPHAVSSAKSASAPSTTGEDEDMDGDVTMTEADTDVGAEITVDAAEDDPEQPVTVSAAGEREREREYAASQDTASLSLAVHVESTPAETLVDDGISAAGDPDARARNPAISFQPVRLPPRNQDLHILTYTMTVRSTRRHRLSSPPSTCSSSAPTQCRPSPRTPPRPLPSLGAPHLQLQPQLRCCGATGRSSR